MENTIIIEITEKNNGINPRYTFHLQGIINDKNGRKVIDYTEVKYGASGTLYEHMNKLSLELGEKYPTVGVFFTLA